jgi:excisionase family DNA binding protein
MEPLIKASEVRELLGLKSVQTVYSFVNAGKLPAVRLGAKTLRFRRSDVEKFIERQRVGA